MNCEKIVEKHQICLGHIIRTCPECIADEKNKQCYWDEYKKYNPIIVRTFYVGEVKKKNA